MGIPTYSGHIPRVTASEMIKVDRAMEEEMGVSLVQMMENAGRCLAHLARVRYLGGDPGGREVVVLAGRGGNGGGAMACARRLHIWGAHVHLFTSRPEGSLSPVTAGQLKTLTLMGVPVSGADDIAAAGEPALIVDGIIGYSLRGNPGGCEAILIGWANARSAPVLSLDLPSGVDSTTGEVYDPAIRADATLTLALPKVGLDGRDASLISGDLYLADIGVPPSLYPGFESGGNPLHLFSKCDVIRLR